MRHALHRTVFEGETVVDLGDNGIDVQNGDIRRIALHDIVSGHLRMTPLRAQTGQFICEVEPRNGVRLRICSASYRHLIIVKNRAATWRPLVEHLNRRLADLDPPPQFLAGDSRRRFALHVGVRVALAAFALWLGSLWPMLGIVTLVPIGVLFALYWYRRLGPNVPRFYDPRALPPVLLPRYTAPQEERAMNHAPGQHAEDGVLRAA